MNAFPQIVRMLMSYVLMPRECLTVPEQEDASVHTGGSGAQMSHASGMDADPGCLCAVEDGPVGMAEVS